MPGTHLGWRRLACLTALSASALLPGLGGSGRLTYHEAFVAQGAREILGSGDWSYPTIGGLPWLEKPPLPWWLVAGFGRCVGGVTEGVARLPSVLAAFGLVLAVAVLATRHYGPQIGLLAGAVQITTTWTVLRGRLAEADVLLACLIAWAIVAYDEVVTSPRGESDVGLSSSLRFWHWLFFVLLGVTALVKGIGFGAVLILAVISGMVVWQRDVTSLRRLHNAKGWALALVIGLSWPLLMIVRHGYGALWLWTLHVADRLGWQQGAGPFASEPWREYVIGLLSQALPWTPLALAGAWHSLSRLFLHGKGSKYTVRPGIPAIILAGDRLLWVWAVIPVGLLALAPVKNAHYVISAQVPWSIWAALALARLGGQLGLRGYRQNTLVRVGHIGFVGLALAYGLGLWLIGPWFDRRGVEWAFYEAAGRQIPASMPLSLLYDDWDRNPYQSPFGLVPHDLAVRLFYLGRSVCWHNGVDSLMAHDSVKSTFLRSEAGLAATQCHSVFPRVLLAVIGRDRDLPALEELGHVQILARGPSIRSDRTYFLFRITYEPIAVHSAERVQPQAIR